MPTLSGEQARQLRDALCDAFTPKTLEEMVRFRLGERLDDLVEPAALQQRAFQLVEVYDRRGTVAGPIRAAYETMPDNPLVRGYCEAHAPWAFTPAPPPDQIVDGAATGVRRLGELLEAVPESRLPGLARSLRGDFGDALRTINTIAAYKALHACLHNVQFRLYREIKRAVESFATNDEAREQLEAYMIDLRAEVDRARPQAEKLEGEIHWVRILHEVAVDLSGLGAPGRPPAGAVARRAILRLNGVLVIEPSRVNGVLTAAARTLPLLKLIEALRALSDTTTAAAIPAAVRPLLDGFRSGLGDLEEFRPLFLAVVEGHIHWQGIDNLLRVAEAELARAVESLAGLWPYIREDTLALTNVHATTDWAKDLTRLIAEVDAAENNPARIRSAFALFRRRAMQRF
jgi:hypothetical protein